MRCFHTRFVCTDASDVPPPAPHESISCLRLIIFIQALRNQCQTVVNSRTRPGESIPDQGIFYVSWRRD